MRDLTGYRTGATELAEITIPQLWHALDNTEPGAGAATAATPAGSTSSTRAGAVRDALGTLVTGHLAGMFDAATTLQVDWDAPIQSLSLSRLDPLGDQAVGVALTCLNSWGRAMTQLAQPGDLRIVVRDESWKQMRLGLDAVKSLDADLRLSRHDGCIPVLVAHKPSDMTSVGDAGSQAVAIAKDLIHLCGTKVLHGQDKQVSDELAEHDRAETHGATAGHRLGHRRQGPRPVDRRQPEIQGADHPHRTGTPAHRHQPGPRHARHRRRRHRRTGSRGGPLDRDLT